MDPIEELLARALEEIRPHDNGSPADYIPQLAAADPDRLALAVVGPRGKVRAAGDATTQFTIQSISKPFVLALALEAVGFDAVFSRVGAEPSGEPFNAISLEPGSGRPANPLINAGAIATTSLVPGAGIDDRMSRIIDMLSAFAGRRLELDEAVYRSESETGDRNRALAHLMRAQGVFRDPVETIVDTYFRQCSLLVDVADLAVMAATLAFSGRNPVTGEQVVSERTARHVVSIMSSCGMYDFSGQWLLEVGVPAKSGVSGGLLAVASSQFGIGAFSPRLDAHGNTVRGRLIVEKLSDRFEMHVFQSHESISAPGLSLHEEGGVKVVTIRGELGLSGTERVIGMLRELAGADPHGAVILDASELGRTHPAALTVLRAQVDALPDGFEIRG